MKPYKDALIVVEDSWEVEAPGGILLGRGQIEPDPWLTGHVVSVGDGAPDKRGVQRPPGFSVSDDPASHRPEGYKPGDRVCFRRGAGMELPGKHLLLKEHQVVPALLDEGFIHLRNPYAA